jgi:hypothetical protein
MAKNTGKIALDIEIKLRENRWNLPNTQMERALGERNVPPRYHTNQSGGGNFSRATGVNLISEVWPNFLR